MSAELYLEVEAELHRLTTALDAEREAQRELHGEAERGDAERHHAPVAERAPVHRAPANPQITGGARPARGLAALPLRGPQ